MYMYRYHSARAGRRLTLSDTSSAMATPLQVTSHTHYDVINDSSVVL